MKITGKYIIGGVIFFSAICLLVFYIAWKEPTTPDNLSVIPLKILLASQNIKEKDKQLQALDSAEKIINSILQRKPNDHSVRFAQGIYYSLTENYAQAISIYNNNLKTLDSINNKSLYNSTITELARNYYMQGAKLLTNDTKNTRAGMNSMYKSFDYVPYYEPSVIKLASLNIDNNRIDSAKTLLTGCIKINPQDAVLNGLLGYAYLKENNFKESEYYLTLAHSIDPDNANVNTCLKILQNQPK